MDDSSDIASLAPIIAGWLHINPATFVLYVVLIIKFAGLASRMIPANAVGFWGVVRQVCAVIGIETSNKIAPGVTTQDVALSALKTPEVAEKPPVAEKLTEETKP